MHKLDKTLVVPQESSYHITASGDQDLAKALNMIVPKFLRKSVCKSCSMKEAAKNYCVRPSLFDMSM